MGTLSVDKLLKTSAGAAEFTLPATDGTAGQVWQTDGAGQLSVGAYTIPANAVGSSQIATDAVTATEIAANAVTTTEIIDNAVTGAKIAMGSDATGDLLYYNGTDYVRLAAGTSAQVLTSAGVAAPTWSAAAGGGGGKVLKVYQATKTDTTSIAGTTWANITGLTLTTDAPDSTGSRFFVLWNVMIGIPAGTATMTRLERTPSGGSDVYPFIGDAAGSRPRTSSGIDGGSGQYTMMPFNGTYLDSPASSVALTYTIQWKNSTGSTAYLNRTFNDRDTANYDARAASSLVVMEIGS